MLSASQGMVVSSVPTAPTNEAMIKVAEMYYRQRLTQSEVAARVGVSRQTVSRLLQRAETLGIVTIEIHSPGDAAAALGERLAQRFGLASATVVDTGNAKPDRVLRQVARTAAVACHKRITPGMTLGLAWGPTMLEVTRNLPKSSIKGLTVVQIDGSIPGGPGMGGAEYLVREAADILGATAHPLMVPLYVDSEEIRDALIRDSRTARTLEIARNADLAIFSLGTVDKTSTLLASGFLSSAELSRLAKDGAVGEFCGHFFALDGSPRGLDLTARSVALSMQDIGRIPARVVVASGLEKCAAVTGALSGGHASDLFLDRRLAEAVLATCGPVSTPPN